MFSTLWELITHPKIFVIGFIIGYLAPSNIPSIISQLWIVTTSILNWIKSKL